MGARLVLYVDEVSKDCPCLDIEISGRYLQPLERTGSDMELGIYYAKALAAAAVQVLSEAGLDGAGILIAPGMVSQSLESGDDPGIGEMEAKSLFAKRTLIVQTPAGEWTGLALNSEIAGEVAYRAARDMKMDMRDAMELVHEGEVLPADMIVAAFPDYNLQLIATGHSV